MKNIKIQIESIYWNYATTRLAQIKLLDLESVKCIGILLFLFYYSTPNLDSQNSFVFWPTLRETSLTFLNISAYSYVGSGFRQFQLSIYDYINNIPPSPAKYTETRESYYIATWVLVTLCIIFILACTSLIILLIRAARKRTYSTKNLDSKL